MKARRIILDTNLWISFLITKNLQGLDNHLAEGGISLLFSEELFEEFIEVTKRPKLKKYFKAKDVKSLLQLMSAFSEMIDVTSEVDLCRDEKDNFLLSLAIDSKADFLITGDKDLLSLKKVENTAIVSYSEFLEEINN